MYYTTAAINSSAALIWVCDNSLSDCQWVIIMIYDRNCMRQSDYKHDIHDYVCHKWNYHNMHQLTIILSKI